MPSNADLTLKAHHIRSTDCRRDMLDFFYKKGNAISYPQLEKAMKQHDRTTIFRNLLFFEEHGFIHKLSDGEGVLKYALCEEKCFGHAHKDEHLHFTCSTCHETYCLEEVKLPAIKVPDGFSLASVAVVAKGVCKNCA